MESNRSNAAVTGNEIAVILNARLALDDREAQIPEHSAQGTHHTVENLGIR